MGLGAPRDLLRHSVKRRVPEVHSFLSRVRARVRVRVRLMDRARRKARAGLMARAKARSRASCLLGRGAAVGRSEDWRDPVYGLDLHGGDTGSAEEGELADLTVVAHHQ